MSPALALLCQPGELSFLQTQRGLSLRPRARLSVCADFSVAIFFLTRVVIYAARVRWVLLPALFARHLESCCQLGGLLGPLLGADIFLLLSGKEILVNPDLQGLIILALQAFNPRHTHIHSLIHLSIAAQRALSRIVSKCNNQNVIRVIYVKSLQKPMSKYSYFEEKFVSYFIEFRP